MDYSNTRGFEASPTNEGSKMVTKVFTRQVLSALQTVKGKELDKVMSCLQANENILVPNFFFQDTWIGDGDKQATQQEFQHLRDVFTDLGGADAELWYMDYAADTLKDYKA